MVEYDDNIALEVDTSDIKLSATRINMFLKCKFAYWKRYHEKVPQVKTPSFKIGTTCHTVLEMAGNICKEKGTLSKKDIQKVLAYYDEVAIKEGIDNGEDHEDGLQIVKDKLSNWDDSQKIIGLEIKFGFTDEDSFVTEEGVPLIGAIDKVVVINNDTLLVIDYKTSKVVPSTDQLKHDNQISMYDLVASKKWPDYDRIILGLDMLRSGALVPSYRTDEDRKSFSKYLSLIYKEMLKFKEKDAVPSLNIFCGWCDYRSICSTYNKLFDHSKLDFKPIQSLSSHDLVDEWNKIRSHKKAIEEREKELNMFITELIKVKGERLVYGDEEVYTRQNSRTNYNASDIYEIVPREDFIKLVTVSQKSIDDYIKANPGAGHLIKKVATTNFTKPFLQTRKLKK